MLTLNSDDPAMFRTSLVEEYALVQEAFGFTDEHLRELARNSFEASFLPAEKKIEISEFVDAATPRSLSAVRRSLLRCSAPVLARRLRTSEHDLELSRLPLAYNVSL